MSRQKLDGMFKSRELNRGQLAQCDRIRAAARELAIEFLPTDTREKQIALQKLEEVVMWAEKGVSAQ